MAQNSRSLAILGLIAVIALALVPQFADRFYIQLLTKIMIMAIFAMSLGLLVSGAGLVSFGHAAFFGLGAYIVALITPATAPVSAFVGLPTALIGTALAALAIGALAVRTSGIYFIMLTLAFAQMFFYLFHDLKALGGSDGLFLAARPSVAIGGITLLDLDDRPTLFYTVLAAMVLTYAGIGMLLKAPFGKAILGIRVNEQRMRALGYNTYLYKLVAFVIAGTLAGLAGFFYATQNAFVNPALMSWRESGTVLMMVILGGLRARLGPVLGAFRAAIATRGPVQVDIPRDIYYGKWEEEELQPAHYRTDGRYGGAPDYEVERAARLLLEAKSPAILAGLGAVDSNAGKAIAALAERFSAPVACVWLHNDAFPSSHELAVGPIGYQGSLAAMKLLAEADVLLALGTRLNSFGTNPQYDFDYFPHKTKLIHNSINPLELGALRPIEVGLVGDCAAVVNQLLKATDRKKPSVDRDARRKRISDEKRAWADKLKSMSLENGRPINPRRALWEISHAIPKNAAVVCDVGNVSGTAGAYFGFDAPRQFFGPGSLGGIGVGFPTALGVKLGRPDLPVLALVGDGAWSMSLQEVMTAVREKINLVTVIFNNSQYGAEKRNQYDFFNERFFWTDLENPSFAAVAAEMGAIAVRVDDPKDIGPKLREAFSAERPVVLDVQIDPKVLSEPYRRDALRMPERLLPRYRN